MKLKIFGLAVVLVLGLLLVTPVSAVKPVTNNLASAVVVPWHLSAAVMPVPPYGSLDIPGSDTASKLIVNQPTGNTEVAITGVMKGLTPLTTYTVYLSPGYTPYTKFSTPNVVGTYKWLVIGTYEHDLVITTQNPDGTFSGTGYFPTSTSPDQSTPTTETITGKVEGDQIQFTVLYNGPRDPGYTATVFGTIAPDGSMSGTNPLEWHTTSGHATWGSGSTGWPGLFTSAVPEFTFTTDEFGAGSWHVNLKDANFASAGSYLLSVWVNGGGATVLISDNFNVVVGA